MAPRKKKENVPKILKYPDSAMQSAFTAVREGRFKIREAARHFGVPHSTLISKLKGRVPLQRQMGPGTFFTKNEGNLLVKYIKANAAKGIPINRRTLLETVKKILDDDQRVTPFKNNTPGKKWVSLFYERHPDITERKAEGISTARANVSAQDLKNWHKGLENYLTEQNVQDILKDPKRIFNADESGFQTCPETGTVLGPANMKNFYQIKSGKEKEQITVMVTINAAGQVVPPMIVYPLIRISREIANNVPEDWAIGKSDSGWMNGPLFYEFIANIFDPWIKQQNIQKPVLLLVDGHRSHLTLEVSEYCDKNQIIAYALFPNSIHITQPADVSVFKCMKSGWKNIVSDYKRRSGNRQITRAGFAPLLAKVFEEKVTPEIITNGFTKCGIYPFDINGMDLTRCMDHNTRKIAPVSPPRPTTCTESASMIGVETLLLFESFMRRNRVEEFRRSNEKWEGDESAKELFYVWKKFRQFYLLDSSAPSTENVEDVCLSESQRELTLSPSVLPPQQEDAEGEDATKCITLVVNAPDFVEEVEISDRDDSPISKQLDDPKNTQISSRIKRTASELLDLLDEAPNSANDMSPFSEIPDFPEKTFGFISSNPSETAINKPREAQVPSRVHTPALEIVSRWKDDQVHTVDDTQFSLLDPTTCIDPVSRDSIVPEASGNNIMVLKSVPNLPDASKTPTRCNTPKPQAPNLPEESRTPTRSSTSALVISNLPEEAETNTAEASSSTTNNLIVVQKQKQISPAFGKHIIWPSDSPIKNVRKERFPISSLSKKWQNYFIIKDKEKEEKARKLEMKKRLREENKGKKSTQVSKRFQKQVTKSGEQEARNINKPSTSKVERPVNKRKKQRGLVLNFDEEYEPKKKTLKKNLIKQAKKKASKVSESETEGSDEIEINYGSDTESFIEEEEEVQTSVENISVYPGFTPKQDDFVVVTYEGEVWPGQVVKLENGGAYVRCMSRCGLSWKWPEKEDLIFYPAEDIQFKINEPKRLSSKRALYHVPELEERWGKPKK